MGRWTRWERTSADHVAGRSGVIVWRMVPGRHKDRVRSRDRRQHRRLSRRSRWRAPAPADHRTLHRRSAVVVEGWAVDLFRIDARRSDSGHLAGLSDGGEAIRLTRNGGFEPRESPDGRYLFFSTVSGGAPMAARLMRVPLAGGPRKWCSSAFGRFCGRSPTPGSCSSPASRTSMRSMCTFSDRRAARVGRLGFRIPGMLHAHDGVARRALGIGDEAGAVRLRPHAARQLSMSRECDSQS